MWVYSGAREWNEEKGFKLQIVISGIPHVVTEKFVCCMCPTEMVTGYSRYEIMTEVQWKAERLKYGERHPRNAPYD